MLTRQNVAHGKTLLRVDTTSFVAIQSKIICALKDFKKETDSVTSI
jgi:hypothetical protein